MAKAQLLRIALATGGLLAGSIGLVAPSSTSAATSETPVLRVTPRLNLADGQDVLVRGYGFPGGHYLLILECQRGSNGPTSCDRTAEGANEVFAHGYMPPQNFVVYTWKTAKPAVCETNKIHYDSREVVAESTSGIVYASTPIFFRK